MNRKKILTILSAIVLFFAAIMLVYVFIISPSYELSVIIPKNISVNLSKINDKGDYELVESIKTSKIVKVKKGNYCVRPTDDEKYSQTPECAIIDKSDAKLSIEPDFSDDYLKELLAPQLSEIHSVITAKYSPLINSYFIGDGQLYAKGEWYGTTLSEITSSRYRGDTYRVILNKQADKWVIAARPQIVLSSIDYPNIPFKVLSSVNKLPSEY